MNIYEEYKDEYGIFIHLHLRKLYSRGDKFIKQAVNKCSGKTTQWGKE